MFQRKSIDDPNLDPTETLLRVDRSALLAAYEALLASEKQLSEAEAIDGDTGPMLCGHCGKSLRPGELACANCNILQSTNGKTVRINSIPSSSSQGGSGETVVAKHKPITFEIEGEAFPIYIDDVITVGRTSDLPGDNAPDIDLINFGAANKGVSRQHVRIKRRGILLYVADLGSTNGTMLNGRRLLPHTERLLRHGDELMLSHLSIVVKYTSPGN